MRTTLVERQIETIAADKGCSIEETAVELLMGKQPSKQFVTPQQIGALTAFLCSPAAEQITGTTQSIDGGWTAQ